MAISTNPVTLQGGLLTTVVNAATGIGNANSQLFNISVRPDFGQRQFLFSAVKTGAFTALTADLQSSADGGNTWETAPDMAGIDLLGGATAFYIAPGFIYRFNIDTFTGGTNVTIVATVA